MFGVLLFGCLFASVVCCLACSWFANLLVCVVCSAVWFLESICCFDLSALFGCLNDYVLGFVLFYYLLILDMVVAVLWICLFDCLFVEVCWLVYVFDVSF